MFGTCSISPSIIDNLLFQCTFDVWCAHECKWGLIFDNRSTELIKPGCKLPPLCPNCLSKNLLSQQDLEAEQHMENSSVVEDVSQMNSPMCTYTHQETCDNMEIFQPVYSPGARSGTGSGYCTNQFRICYRGWDCLMRLYIYFHHLISMSWVIG